MYLTEHFKNTEVSMDTQDSFYPQLITLIHQSLWLWLWLWWWCVVEQITLDQGGVWFGTMRVGGHIA